MQPFLLLKAIIPVNQHCTEVACMYYVLQVPMIRARILEGKDWRALAEDQKIHFFGTKAAALSETRMQSMLRNLEAMLDMQPDLAADKVTAYTPDDNPYFVQVSCMYRCALHGQMYAASL